MKAPAFAYARAESLDEAIDLLREHGEDARVLAGGQSLVASLNMRLSSPSILIDINGVPGLDGVEADGEGLRIGALVRHSRLGRDPAVARHAPPITAAVPFIAHPAIRNRGTIGGSVAFADPAAELPACLLALDGTVELRGRQGTRSIPVDAFYLGLYETALAPDELVVALHVPALPAGRRTAFGEIGRRHGDYALAGLCATADVTRGRLTDCRLAFFAMGEKVVRARAAEEALASDGIEAAVAALGQDLAPFDDAQASAAARMHLAGVLLRRAARDLEGETDAAAA